MPGAGRRGRSLTHPRPGTRSKNSHVKLHQFRPLCGCGFEVYVISPLLEAYSLSQALQFAMVATSAHSLSSSSLGRSLARSRAVRVPLCLQPLLATIAPRPPRFGRDLLAGENIRQYPTLSLAFRSIGLNFQSTLRAGRRDVSESAAGSGAGREPGGWSASSRMAGPAPRGAVPGGPIPSGWKWDGRRAGREGRGRRGRGLPACSPSLTRRPRRTGGRGQRPRRGRRPPRDPSE